MKKLIIPILLIAILLMNCKDKETIEICDNFSLEEATLTENLDYEVINAILDEYYGDVKFMLIEQKTQPVYDLYIESAKRKLKDMGIKDSSIFKDYRNKNNQQYFLSEKLNRPNIKLINKLELNCLFSEKDAVENWEKYYRKYKFSSGNYTFARPGFNKNKDKAIIEYGYMAGPMTGEGSLVLLEKIDNKWKVIKRLSTWAS